VRERCESLRTPAVDLVVLNAQGCEIASVALSPLAALEHAIAALRCAIACERRMNPVSSRSLAVDLINAVALLTLEGVERP
jgi:hypothetical protein